MNENELLHSIDRKLSGICSEIKHLRNDLDDNKQELKDFRREINQEISKIYDRIDMKSCEQGDFCILRENKHELKFDKLEEHIDILDDKLSRRIKYSHISFIITLIATIIIGSYSYTSKISDMVDENKTSIRELIKDYKNLDEKMEILHNIESPSPEGG